jgi:hypothetical protein
MRLSLIIFWILILPSLYAQEYFGYEVKDSLKSTEFLMHFSSDTRTQAVIIHWEKFLSEKVNGENFQDYRKMKISKQGEILAIADEHIYVYPEILQSSFSSSYIIKLHNKKMESDQRPLSEGTNTFLHQLYLEFSHYLYHKFLPIHVKQIEKKIKSIQKKQNRQLIRLQKLQKKQYAHQKEIERRNPLVLKISQDIALTQQDIVETNDEITSTLNKRQSMDFKQLNLNANPKIVPIK